MPGGCELEAEPNEGSLLTMSIGTRGNVESTSRRNLADLLAAAGANGVTHPPLIDEVYEDLKILASRHLRRERDNLTLQTTALVHETWLELARQRRVVLRSSSHFFGLASILMARILRLRARRRGAAKRGGAVRPETLPEELPNPPAGVPQAELLEGLYAQLAKVDPFKADVVRLRVWHGLTVPECAAQLGVSRATVDRHWALARSWFYDALSP